MYLSLKFLINIPCIKFEFLSYNFPVISKKNTLFNEYVVKLKSLPDIKKDYLISYKNIILLSKLNFLLNV